MKHCQDRAPSASPSIPSGGFSPLGATAKSILSSATSSSADSRGPIQSRMTPGASCPVTARNRPKAGAQKSGATNWKVRVERAGAKGCAGLSPRWMLRRIGRTSSTSSSANGLGRMVPVILAGHGEPTAPADLAGLVRYLEAVKPLLAANLGKPDQAPAITAEIAKAFPDYRIPSLLTLGLSRALAG